MLKSWVMVLWLLVGDVLGHVVWTWGRFIFKIWVTCSVMNVAQRFVLVIVLSRISYYFSSFWAFWLVDIICMLLIFNEKRSSIFLRN